MSNETNEQAVSLTEALSANAVPLSAVAAGKVLLVAGVTAVAWRPSSKADRPAKSYKVATPLGESLGAVNDASALPTGDPTILKFLPSAFADLWASSQVQAAMTDLLETGDIKLRGGAAGGKSEMF